MMALISIEDLRRLEALERADVDAQARREAALAAAAAARAAIRRERGGSPCLIPARSWPGRERRGHDPADLRGCQLRAQARPGRGGQRAGPGVVGGMTGRGRDHHRSLSPGLGGALGDPQPRVLPGDQRRGRATGVRGISRPGDRTLPSCRAGPPCLGAGSAIPSPHGLRCLLLATWRWPRAPVASSGPPTAGWCERFPARCRG